MSRRPRGQRRDYARTDRVGELIRQIVAGQLERLGDERLELVSITGVQVDNELEQAVIYYDLLDAEAADEVETAWWEVRGKLRSAVAREARLRRTPDLVFEIDPSIAAGARVEELLSGLGLGDDDEGSDGPAT
ncbi:MAG: 30S ribosome-binding factor RbfA [Actinomycetota bacterium]